MCVLTRSSKIICVFFGFYVDGADYLRQILPIYFIHHKLSLRRLRQFVRKLPSEDRNKLVGKVSGLDASTLHSLLDAWIATATAADIRRLPDILSKTGASDASERLQSKLQKVDAHLKRLTHQCSSHVHTGNMLPMSH